MKRIRILVLLPILLTALLGCALLSPSSTRTPTPVNPPAALPSPTQAPTEAPAGTAATVPATAVPSATVPAASAPSPTLDKTALANFTYQVFGGIPLKDGAYRGDHGDSRLVEPVAFGDLNGDGQQDAAVILATNTGGSGTFITLSAVLNQNGTPVEVSNVELGDRQGLRDMKIIDSRIIVDYLTQGPNDGLCCPSQHVQAVYLLENNVLRRGSYQHLESPDTVATPLPNNIFIDQPGEWGKTTGTLQVQGRVAQTPAEKKLTYHVTNREGTLVTDGEVPVSGEPGGPGTFSFQVTLPDANYASYSVDVVDAAGGTLRGRAEITVFVEK